MLYGILFMGEGGLRNQYICRTISILLDFKSFTGGAVPISNDYPKEYIYRQNEKQLSPKLLFQVYARELYNSMVRQPEEEELNYAIDKQIIPESLN